MKPRKEISTYYFKLMKYNIGVFVLIILVFCCTFCFSNFHSSRTQILLPYDRVLQDLHNNYQQKHEDLFRVLIPLYYNQQNVGKLLSVVGERVPSQDHETLTENAETMVLVAAGDTDVKGIVIYDNESGNCVLYDTQKQVYLPQNDNQELITFMQDNTGTRRIYKTNIVTLSQEYEKRLYGIAGSFMRGVSHGNENNRYAGFILLYDEDRLYSRFNFQANQESLSSESRYMICTYDGETIFDSWRQYDGLNVSELSDEIVDGAAANMLVDYKSWYVSVKKDPTREYFSLYFLPKSLVLNHAVQNSLPVILFTIVSCLVLIVIMFLSSKVYEKRLINVKYAMKRIGENDLSYRIVDTNHDEFSEISHTFNIMCDKLKSTIEKGYLYEIKQHKAELYALQTSINPHFLYNTLESIKAKLWENGEYDGAELIVMLSRIFNYQFHGNSFVTLGEELENLENYVNFFMIRYDGRFTCDISVDESLLQYGLPKFSLQPLLENFFIHGMTTSDDNMIKISAMKQHNLLTVKIADNGNGVSSERLAEIRENLRSMHSESGMGMFNTHERLRLIFGKDCGLKIDSDGIGKGTTIELVMHAMKVSELQNIQEQKLKTKPD